MRQLVRLHVRCTAVDSRRRTLQPESIPLRPAVDTRYTAISWFEVGDDMHGRGQLPRPAAATSDLDYNGLRPA